MWFSRDVRFAFEGTVLSVLVEKEFQLGWLRDAFAHNLELVARELLGPSATVKFALSSDARQSIPEIKPTSDLSRATFLPFPPQATTDAAATSAPAAQPAKRKRGRPRKSETTTTASPTPSSSLEPALISTFAPTARVAEQILAPAISQNTAAAVAQESLLDVPPAPVKRKRGRPRKNPLPEQPSAPTSPFAQNILEAANPVDSFAEILSRASRREELGGARSDDFGLSEQERVALAVGSFENEPTTAMAPRKRGRPKGSTKRAAQASADSVPDVLRDENGFNIVRIAKETPRVKSDDTERRFATLGSFVQGFSNGSAIKAVEISLYDPGLLNPILIYGPTSVGKTHLLEGACEAFARLQGAKPPLFMTAEQFTTLFIQSLRGGGGFRDRFKNISLFALDDIHFLEGKTSTQTELLNVHDYLRARGVQMIFSSNCSDRELKLRGELVTRLQSGMSAEIKTPERETLAQIFRRMALERRLAVPDDVCRYVVSRFATHARELSGALNRLFAAHLTTGAPITVELARTALADLAPIAARSVKLEDVERVVQETFGLEQKALKSSSRAKKCADPRALAMWLARKYTRSALTEIGEYFGGRRHSAVISAQKKVDRWLAEHEAIASPSGVFSVQETLERLERSLGVARV